MRTNEPTGVLGLFSDIGERKRIEEERDRQSALLQALFDAAPVAIAVTEGPEHRYVMANPMFASQAPEGGLLGRPAAAVFSSDAAGVRALDQVWRTGQPVVLDEIAHGDRYWNGHHVPLRNPDGSVRAILAIDQEITDVVRARREAEARAREASESHYRFARLVEGGIIGMVVAMPDRVTYANDVYLNLIGRTREDLEAGRIDWRAITPPEHLERDDRAIAEMNERGACTPYEKDYVLSDGSRVPVLLGCSQLRRDPVPEWVAFVIDLRERKRLERQLFEAQKLESIGVLAGGVAHDFNNLLTSIMGGISMALDSLPAGDEGAPFLRVALTATERAAELTRQLLAYAGKGRFVIEPLDVSTVIDGVLDLLRASVPSTIELEVRLERGLPAIQGDRTHVQQIVTNLVLNASEAIGSGAGRIDLRTWAEGGSVWIEVRDTGSGIDPAVQARIFEPFFTTKFTGRGLGLAAVQGAVRAQGGSIEVHSRPGEGARFLVRLPAAGSAIAQLAAPPVRSAGGSGCVLLVDDDPVIRQIGKISLERAGYGVLLASDGPEAIRICARREQAIDLVVLDLTMPRMSGEETFSRIRELLPGVPVLLSSGYSEVEAERRFAGLGVAGFLAKPYSAQILAARAAAAIGPQVGR